MGCHCLLWVPGTDIPYYVSIYCTLQTLHSLQMEGLWQPSIKQVYQQHFSNNISSFHVSVCQEDPLEKGMATHSSTLVWEILWTEEPDRLQFMGSQRVGHDWAKAPWCHILVISPFFKLSHYYYASYNELWPEIFDVTILIVLGLHEPCPYKTENIIKCYVCFGCSISHLFPILLPFLGPPFTLRHNNFKIRTVNGI